MTETVELLNWFEKEMEGCAIVSDDRGNWAVACTGFQNVPDVVPDDIETTFFIQKDEWFPTIQAALNNAYKEWSFDMQYMQWWEEWRYIRNEQKSLEVQDWSVYPNWQQGNG